MGTPLAKNPVGQIKLYISDESVKKRFEEMLGKRSGAFLNSIINTVRNSNALQNCSPASVMSAATVAATLNLPIDPALGQAAIVPYKTNAVFQIMYKGVTQLCIRSGQHAYNVALIASMIAHHGEQKAQNWLEGLKANLAQKPAGNDRAQVKGVYSGVCDIAIGNTYYMAKMQTNEKKPEQKEWARSVKMLFPNSKGRGVHINISGIVLAKYAPNKTNGVALMEYLSSASAQKIYAQVNHEYPVKEGVAWSERVTSWGSFKPDPISLEQIAKLRKKASELVDIVRFNDGPSS